MRTLGIIAAGLLASSTAAAECPTVGTGAEIDVVTFNAWGLPAPIAKHRKDRLPKIAAWLTETGFDVVGLQEVWKGALPLLSLDNLFTPNVSEEGDSGLAFLSEYGVNGGQLERFNDARGIEKLKKKGVLKSAVDVPGFGELSVWNTHLQAQKNDRSAAVRGKQVEQILASAERVEGPMVLMGDFNLYGTLDEDRVSHERLVAAGFSDVADTLGDAPITYEGEAERFDRVYLRQGEGRCLAPTKLEVVGDAKGLSDHKAVRAVLSLSGT